MYKKFSILISFIFPLLMLSACSQVDKGEINELATRTATGIAEAEVLEADQYAPVALRSAKMKLDDAKGKIAQEEYQQARLILEEAMVDAENARVKTRSEKAQASAKQIQQDIRVLESEL